MSLEAENKRLKEENNSIVASINTSKLLLETLHKQEVEGITVLKELADKVEKASSEAGMAKKEADGIHKEVAGLLNKKQTLLADIEAVEKVAKLTDESTKREYEALKTSIAEDIQVKQTELSEVLSKIKAEKFNLNELKAQSSGLQTSISMSAQAYDDIAGKCANKNVELDNLHGDIIAVTKELSVVKHTLNDTVSNIETNELLKAKLIDEISALQQTIIDAHAEVIDIKAEITKLQVARDEAIAEFKASEKKVFELLNREEAVADREEYAKERFKVAGLAY